jgi:hypothetical protein
MGHWDTWEKMRVVLVALEVVVALEYLRVY